MPLEFKDCLNDSPYFRQKLQMHEQELDHTNASIKALIKEVKDLYQAARSKCCVACVLEVLPVLRLGCWGGWWVGRMGRVCVPS